MNPPNSQDSANSANSANSIPAIVGPTASGKTHLGVELALHLGNGEVISCDSVQIYKEIEIATAKPSEEEMRGVPHHLVDYVSPFVDYTAADWARDASEKIREIESRGGRPIIVGGTGFYLRTLRKPLFESPRTDPELRRRLRGIHEEKGAAHLHRMLERLDPGAAAGIPANDYVRSMRALEVFFQTGKRISDLQPERAEPPEFAERIRVFALAPPRNELYERINARARAHFEAGLLDEVKRLLKDGVPPDSNALGSHGYRRVLEYLSGERTLESAIEKTAQDVRNYAKRQLTWFRKEKDVEWLEGFGDDPAVRRKLFELIEEKRP
ncbi:MAG: tRNA (adenosine(37)-N6)-dimethylallyltransferase MiaA [Acidobacteriota bacterium]|nr:MAG: tRNA (adenosine(37)-N6)-dimethylallyltransferase MiaA [Acidobacteriota bacterium]